MKSGSWAERILLTWVGRAAWVVTSCRRSNSPARTSPEALREMVVGWQCEARFTGVKSERTDGRMVAICRIFPTTDWNFGTGACVFFKNRVIALVMPRALRWVRCTVRDWSSNTKPTNSLDCAHYALPASNFFKEMGPLPPTWPERSRGGNKPRLVCNAARPVRWRAEPSGLSTAARMQSLA